MKVGLGEAILVPSRRRPSSPGDRERHLRRGRGRLRHVFPEKPFDAHQLADYGQQMLAARPPSSDP